MSSTIKITPFNGGKGDITGPCTLLELGKDCKILLDCGLPINSFSSKNIKQNNGKLHWNPWSNLKAILST